MVWRISKSVQASLAAVELMLSTLAGHCQARKDSQQRRLVHGTAAAVGYHHCSQDNDPAVQVPQTAGSTQRRYTSTGSFGQEHCCGHSSGWQ